MYSLLLLLLVVNCVESGNILAFLTLPTSRHEPILRELSLGGHGVTVITPNPLKDESLTNLTEIDLHEISHSAWNKYNISTLENKKGSTLSDLEILAETVIALTDAQLSHPEVKRIIKNEKEVKFDVCVVDYLNGALCPLMEIFNCRMIVIASLPLQMLEHEALKNTNHPVLYPDINLPVSKKMNFLERLQSVFHYFFAKGNYERTELLMRKHFGNVWSVSELLGKINLVLTNVNPLLHTPRANIPTVIEIRGLSVGHEKPLPNDLQLFMDSAKQGVIYINLASNAGNVAITDDQMRILLETIEELPYAFLWNYDYTNFERLPKNLKINNSFPQIDILSHQNLKLFINQGRLQDLDEAMYTETPVVILPFYVDQIGNAKKVQDIGMGKYLLLSKLNAADLKSTILEVLSKKFAENAENLYDLVTDEQNSAHSEILWWIEYVLRNDVIYHLKNPVIDTPFYIYFMLDVVGFVLVVLFGLVSFLVKFGRFIWKYLVLLNPKGHNKEKNN